VKIKRLAWLTSEAKPNRFVTLTTDVNKYPTPLQAWQDTSAQVPELIRALRKRFGSIEYLRVTELTKAGYPHYHMLLRSAYLPQPVVKAWWESTTGNSIVDVRKVNNSFNAYWYLVKYLTKLHKLEWTERHVSYSKHFFQQAADDIPVTWELCEKHRNTTHPHEFLMKHFANERVMQLRPGRWLLPHAPAEELVFDPPEADELGNDKAIATWPPKQRTLPLTGVTNVHY
jgi:hypothetical protein